ncbi:hypothetical protein [Streptomyces sp. NPDC057694]|uniref:hypothetical protein n=1 Tax=Streptomyces sp. NPDC057694 TaxID=3346216 RepID=UPI00367E7467
MKIDPQDRAVSFRRRWGVPLGVATGVTAVSVAAVAVFSGVGDAKPDTTDRALSGGSPTKTASPSPRPSDGAQAGGTGSSPSSDRTGDPNAFTITDTKTTAIDPGTAAKILSSCLGADAAQYHAVAAVRAPLASRNADGVVIGINSADQYVQCASEGDKGSSPDSPPTFINDRLWGTGRVIEYFDSTLEPAGNGKHLAVGAGHYSSDVAKVTVSFGDQKKEYPTVMAGGAFVYAAALKPDTPVGRHYMGPDPHIHAYDAAGKEIYNQAEDPKFRSN